MGLLIDYLVFLFAIHLLEEEHQRLGFIVVFFRYVHSYIVIQVLLGLKTIKFMDVVVEIRACEVAQGHALKSIVIIVAERGASFVLHGLCNSSARWVLIPIRNELSYLGHP